MALEIIRELPKPRRGETLYCNCQKESCFPCQNTAVVLGNTEDGSLQLCRECRKEYAIPALDRGAIKWIGVSED